MSSFDDLYSLSEASSIWNIDESVIRKAILSGKLKENIDVKKFGKQWVVRKETMDKIYGFSLPKKDNGYDNSERKEIIYYISEIIYNYSKKYGLSIKETGNIFNEFNIIKYIVDCYDYIHLGSIDNETVFIKKRISRGLKYES